MSDNKKKVYAVHLYNDYSGSPRVLADALSLLCSEGYDCHILTSIVFFYAVPMYLFLSS